MHPFQYLFAGIGEYNKLVPLMWTSVILAIASIALLIFPAVRRNESTLAIACAMVFISLWIDKGFGLIIGGFVPNMFETVTEYWPTLPETLISIGVWAVGFLVLTILYKIAITVREETAGVEIEH
jgi:molybdopterin-containing oxidoreductase family membrane subunit